MLDSRLKVVVLGSTGVLGQKCLKVLGNLQKEFQVIGLSGYQNRELLIAQAKKFAVKRDNRVLQSLPKEFSAKLRRLSSLKEADVVINVISGAAGLRPTMAALERGKTLILGNKESIVAGGPLFSHSKISYLNQIIPLDSEHNAIYEILKTHPEKTIETVTLPASGGPFLNFTHRSLKNVSAKMATNHPVWKMGSKISVESATLLNKGLEIIEAHYIFQIPFKKLKVLIHPQGLVHAIVKFKQAEFPLAYLSKPSMSGHIENALMRSLGKGKKRKIISLNPEMIKKFHFTKPNHRRFPGITIMLKAHQKAQKSKNYLKYMEKFLAKEEKIIQKFLASKIRFDEIFSELKKTID